GAINDCWDWWGYDSPDYARKTGPQVAAVKAMVDRLTGVAPSPAARCYTASNLGHLFADRAYALWGFIYAKGSDQALGWWFGNTTLKESPPGFYAVGNCS